MKRLLIFILLFIQVLGAIAQAGKGHSLIVTAVGAEHAPVYKATVSLLQKDSSVYAIEVTDAGGKASFPSVKAGQYIISVTNIGYTTVLKNVDLTVKLQVEETITLEHEASTLKNVTVTSRKPAIQFLPDKTVVNVEATITNAGGTVMDVLEKSPGITIGRDGAIIMKGKPSVMVLIDGKQTQLSGADLQAYLSGLSASQISTIELIENPGAKYDAAGNAGIINIRTKTNQQKGFNGSLALSLGQGYYTKSNNSINLNYRSGKINLFANYGIRLGKEHLNIWALRKYMDVHGNDSILLQQPDYNESNITGHNLKTGFDFFASKNTTLGLVFTGNLNDRHITSLSTIDWMTPNYVIDSTINTSGTRNMKFERGGININGRHSFNANSEIAADIDIIKFDIRGDQYFQTQLSAPGSPVAATKGNIPSTLNIFTAKVDYSRRFGSLSWEAGLKTASTNTDNLAEYYYYDGNAWQSDLSRSNHFLYDEKNHSAYSSLDNQKGKWHWQLGLRYELTSYKANQLGNSVVKDSAFRRNYGSLFPSGFISINADSNNTFTFRMGRRIDRPQFQNLNPFLVTINKYTFEGGNPFIKPQYTWNFELTHNYKQLLSTGISYSYLKDYFSQIFIIDSNSSNVNKNTIIYTRGNVGTFQNFGISMTLQVPVTSWWNLTTSAIFNHKVIKGVVWAPITAKISQLNMSVNNQFQFKKDWAAEISGYYLTKSQIDLQEYLTPQGELDLGLSKQIMKKKATLRLTMRDLFHTQNYSGYSTFQNSHEPFKIKWDSRVARISFTWRFGTTLKTIKRSGGGATEEIDRVGTGN